MHLNDLDLEQRKPNIPTSKAHQPLIHLPNIPRQKRVDVDKHKGKTDKLIDIRIDPLKGKYGITKLNLSFHFSIHYLH